MTNTSRWLKRNKYVPLEFFMREANKRGAKVHALGCNDIRLFQRFHFYSADSSVFSLGVRYGQILNYEDGKVKHYRLDSKFKLDANKIMEHNIIQMVRFSKYAEQNL